ncbi:MAG: hypothetical protein UU85_C0004G0039 [Candidatus Wolfebacteria bacterium GW2011_GWA2_42_10]|uniref:Uncharacterized protein n=2 Tax=Candidatus Wolfeibacteriota TaxID=1752735 RepID=A0A0G0XK31_9BACT|nr:MAG: hypothetical protein UU38_C0001G0101 [Candidatus Wolfebacteria bacterium GW2011_GWB1_41_12]KKS25280.1 MAG: hypothetical protein UU85_C0004G0039 [Candidatus Wolfebacteria bacterium GW2011_GWA2_42_10]KKT56720.1 MAG: hypothetical protein UW50_C0001G0289 [Candidatus Wolfebacteria bacterium GW2011_GWA1_44_24]
MKKVLILSIFLSIFIANNSFAITAGTIPSAEQLGVSNAPKIEKVDTLVNIIRNIVKWTYIIFFIVAVFFIILAAFTYLTAQADPEKIKTANKQILYAVIAIVIALLAIGFDTIIKSFLQSGA